MKDKEMSQKPKRRIVANYLKDFSCIGTPCEDNCCKGWCVEIDQSTFKKYQKITDGSLASIIKKDLYRNSNSYDKHVDYAHVKLNERKECPFLNEKSLCMIQLKYGEKMLSNVCGSYPRLYNEIDGTIEKSATLSCPVIARLALNSKQRVEFLEEESREDAPILSIRLETKNAEEKMITFLKPIREITMEILRDRELAFVDRLLFLGFFMERLDQAFPTLTLQGLEKEGERFRKSGEKKKQFLESERKKRPADKTPGRENWHIAFLLKTRTLHSEHVIDSRRFLEFVREGEPFVLKCIKGEKGLFQKACSSLCEHDPVFENFFINFVFQSLFPASAGRRPLEAYKELVYRVLLLQQLAAGVLVSRGKITEEKLIELMQVYSKALEHHHSYFDQVKAEMKKRNGDFLCEIAAVWTL